MNRKKRAQSSTLFLLELILAILFFSLASAVCVQFFVKSRLLSRGAQNLNHAVNECSGIAEIVNSSDSMDSALAVIQDIYQEADISGEDSPTVNIYYDKNFTPCKTGQETFILKTALQLDDHMLTADISMEETKPDSSFYQLTVRHYLQRRAADG